MADSAAWSFGRSSRPGWARTRTHQSIVPTTSSSVLAPVSRSRTGSISVLATPVLGTPGLGVPVLEMPEGIVARTSPARKGFRVAMRASSTASRRIATTPGSALRSSSTVSRW